MGTSNDQPPVSEAAILEREVLNVFGLDAQYSIVAVFLVTTFAGVQVMLAASNILTGEAVVAAGLACSIWRFRLVRAIQRKTSPSTEPRSEVDYFKRAFDRNGFTTGMVWAIGAFVALGSTSTPMQTAYILFITSGIGLVATLGAMPSSSLIYLVTLQAGSLGIALVFVDQEYAAWGLCAGLALYVATVVRVSRHFDQMAACSISGRLAAEELNASKSRFLAAVGHEFRAPLFGITGSTRLLQAHLQNSNGIPPDVAEEMLATIDVSSRHLLSLVTRVLEVVSRGNVTLTLDRETVDLVQVIGGTVQSLKALAIEKRLELVFENKLEAVFRMDVDVRRLRQIIYNLLSNALRFTEEGAVRVILARDGTNIRIDVCDSGVGIETQRITEIFKPFSPIAALPTDDVGRGLGLGLAISRTLCEAMGGSIVCTSDVGKGATFTLRLPYLASPAEKPVTQSSDDFSERLGNVPDVTPLSTDNKAPNPPATDILIIDDALISRLVAERMLATAHHHVDCVSDPFDGLLKLACHYYGVVLLDIELPGLSGLELIELFRRLAPGRREPAWIFLSGHVDAKTRADAKQLGAFAYLTKPIDMSELLATVAAADTATAAGKIRIRKSLEQQRLDTFLTDPDFGVDFLEEIVAGYVDECAKRLGDFERASDAASENDEAFRIAAHSLAGYAGEVGDVGTLLACRAFLADLDQRGSFSEFLELLRRHRETIAHSTCCGIESLRFYLAVGAHAGALTAEQPS